MEVPANKEELKQLGDNTVAPISEVNLDHLHDGRRTYRGGCRSDGWLNLRNLSSYLFCEYGINLTSVCAEGVIPIRFDSNEGRLKGYQTLNPSYSRYMEPEEALTLNSETANSTLVCLLAGSHYYWLRPKQDTAP